MADDKKTVVDFPQASYGKSSTRRQHPKETREAARSLYEDSTSPGYQSYPNVAKELGLPRWQTVANWAKEDGWNRKRTEQILSAIWPPKEMVEEHLQGWKEIAVAALKVLKIPKLAPIYAKALEGYEKATKQQQDLMKVIARIEQEETEGKLVEQAESQDEKLFPNLPKLS